MSDSFLVPRAFTERPIRPGTAQDHAAEWITQSIVAGEYAPGDHVPQDEIASKIGISLIPVRESMHRLEGLGQLTYKRQLGYFVAELSEAQLVPMFELRKTLEDYALKKSMPLMTDTDIEKIARYEAICKAALADSDIVALARGHWEFFSLVLGADHQPLAMRFLRQIWDSTNAYAVAYYSTPEGAQGSEKFRANLLEALKKRKMERALEVFDEHRLRTQKTLLTFIKS